ncbi:helix-turn-helix transcriptional regulator [Cupriavidus consociatus]|uniref:helix-turn-helix transcriptional regulator n=1 Tax=Cupriavidus consociatus TaxID=2821357 RepID=UPI001AE900D9|nr:MULTISPECIES: helix-turn-helix transcriptional regulator [unclassified Cupriavidus]MBP0618860.1 helix-turn-helix transcriptional regulator [Cupriavidus sp. LEh25]MDK2655501.1 helix-turn-helix transcriptional regulator [Cupriavidus sp. LEh21]
MQYPIHTLTQLRPILQGFRKSRGLTQANMAAYLGVRQQTYAELEANPATASVERLFKALRVLGVEMVLSPALDMQVQPEPVQETSPVSLPANKAARKTTTTERPKQLAGDKASRPARKTTKAQREDW